MDEEVQKQLEALALRIRSLEASNVRQTQLIANLETSIAALRDIIAQYYA